MDGIKQASTKSGQNTVHLVRYETTTCEAELRSTVFGVANSSVRSHTSGTSGSSLTVSC